MVTGSSKCKYNKDYSFVKILTSKIIESLEDSVEINSSGIFIFRNLQRCESSHIL